jgi:hypothetical protein
MRFTEEAKDIEPVENAEVNRVRKNAVTPMSKLS